MIKRIKLITKLTLLLTMLTTINAVPLSNSIKKTGEKVNLKEKKSIIDPDKDILFKRFSKTSNSIKKLIRTAKGYLGTRYRFGGNTKKGIDCSGFTKVVYKKHGKQLPRTSRQQSKVGKKISKKNLKSGDLVFFSSKKTRGVAHVGIMVSKDKFIHASSGKRKVIISSINKKYYRDHYKWARRV